MWEFTVHMSMCSSINQLYVSHCVHGAVKWNQLLVAEAFFSLLQTIDLWSRV